MAERQLTARALAGRIAETVDGAAEIHANATSNYERAEIAARLGRIFKIRFELYQRKFLIKFLNNFLSQVTPFLFYTVGGYLVIMGRLDIGALVAVIAAYKDLPSPVKELIDWDQQRLDVEVKYQQVMEQFLEEEVAPPELQALVDKPQLPSKGSLRAANLALVDESGTRLVEEVSFEAALDQHVAIVGRPGSGASSRSSSPVFTFLRAARSRSAGRHRAPEAVTGRSIGYVGLPAYLFPRVRDNILYGSEEPSGAAARGALARQAFEPREAERTGNTTLDIEADWVDYEAAGCTGPERHRPAHGRAPSRGGPRGNDLRARAAQPRAEHAGDDVDERVLAARRHMRRLRPGYRGLGRALRSGDVQPQRHARREPALRHTGPARLRHGKPGGERVCTSGAAWTGLDELLLRTGHKVAETMVEPFGLPPGHEFFAQYSFINQDDLPEFQAILKRVGEVGLKGLAAEERQALLALPFKLIAARHRLGLIDESFEARVLEARRHFAANLPENLRDAVEFFDPSATTARPRCRTTSSSARSSPARLARTSASRGSCARCSRRSDRRWW